MNLSQNDGRKGLQTRRDRKLIADVIVKGAFSLFYAMDDSTGLRACPVRNGRHRHGALFYDGRSHELCMHVRIDLIMSSARMHFSLNLMEAGMCLHACSN